MMSRKIQARRPGFTLVGMIVAVAVLGISMAVGMPHLWDISQEIKLKQGARDVLSVMRGTRFRAINEGREYTILALNEHQVQVFQGDDPLDADALQRTIGLPGGVQFRAPQGLPKFEAFPTNAKGAFVVFAADGSASDAGALRLGNGNQHFVEVRLEPASTARMRLNTWDGADWEERG